MGKKISVVIPVYNVQQYIERCVKSLLFNDNVPYEIILVDDGSSDYSGAKCDELEDRYKGTIKVIHKANGGLASARNKGLSEASGDYVAFIDSDDWIENNFISKINWVIENYSPDIIKFGYKRIENGKTIYCDVPYIRDGFYSSSEMNKFYTCALGNGTPFNNDSSFIMSACMAVYSKEVIDESGVLFHSEREILNEDILFNLEFLLNAKNAYVLHDTFYNYECRCGSLTQRYKPMMYERKCKLLSYYEQILVGSDVLNDKAGKQRYAQFVVEHMYDCMVMESQWNNDLRERRKNIKAVLQDKRFKKAQKELKEMSLSKKAKVMLVVFSLENAILFDVLYEVCHSISNRKKRKSK